MTHSCVNHSYMPTRHVWMQPTRHADKDVFRSTRQDIFRFFTNNRLLCSVEQPTRHADKTSFDAPDRTHFDAADNTCFACYITHGLFPQKRILSTALCSAPRICPWTPVCTRTYISVMILIHICNDVHVYRGRTIVYYITLYRAIGILKTLHYPIWGLQAYHTAQLWDLRLMVRFKWSHGSIPSLPGAPSKFAQKQESTIAWHLLSNMLERWPHVFRI